MTPLGVAPGRPNGSYALSDIDTVNLFNGHVNVRLPLINLAGRGSSKAQVSMTWDAPARHQVFSTTDVNGNPLYYVGPPNFWTDVNVHDGGMGVAAVGVGIGGPNFCDVGAFGYNFYIWNTTLTRMYLVEADGTQHEMRDVATGGQALPFTGNCWSTVGPSRGRIFVTTDGFGATYIADTDIRDGFVVNNEMPTGGGGWLLLKDGTRVHIAGGTMRDRNGNMFLSFKDSLNRTISQGVDSGTQCSTNAPGSTFCQWYSYKGFGGAERRIWIGYDGSPGGPTGVFLPNGRSYKFFYNQYNDLSRIDLPSGGSIEYEYEPGLTGPDVFCPQVQDPIPGTYCYFVYRRVVERRLYKEGHLLESRETYSKPEDVYGNNQGFVEKKLYSSTGVLIKSEKHYFHGKASTSFNLMPTAYSAWKDGREYRTEIYDQNGNLLRKVEQSWQQRAPVGWWTGSPDDAPQNDPRISQRVTFLETGLSTTTTFGYDPTVPYNSMTDVRNYDFSGALLRHTQTTYLKNHNGVDYSGSNIQNGSAPHMRDFPVQVSVYDPGGVERARTALEYDNYVADSSHATLMPRPSISGLDSSFTSSFIIRGNVTKTTKYLLTNGAVTGSVSTFAQFDVAGNVVKTIDARGFATNFDFSDRFGGPDGEARTNIAPQELSSVAQTSYAFATQVTNAANHIAYLQFDYYLGAPVDSEDPNGVESSSYFNDPLDRASQVRRAVGTSAESQTTFSYDDVNRIVTATSDLNAYNDNVIKGQTVYDGLGRTVETRQYENSSDFIAVKHVPFVMQQDPDTAAWVRASQSSNPYRPYLGEQPVWTTTFHDALDRNNKVRTPDNSILRMAFNGNEITVTDQIGKKRKSITDALGRLKEMYEDPLGVNYKTSYSYNVFDSLITVTQGAQTRTFVYDSLKRLSSATNPESGTVTYQYDSNGNLTQKTDARSIIATYAYDALNRNTTVDYSDTSGVNPDITFVYDTATNGKGRLRESYAGGTETTGANVEHTKIIGYDALGRPLDQRQRFKTTSVWSAEFQVQRGYNRAGNIASQTYPSGRTVAYAYDSAGRLTSFTGSLGDGVNRTYSNEIVYSSSGGMAKEKFGTDTPLYNKSFYNSRGQLSEIRVGLSPTGGSWERGAIINHYSAQCWGACNGTDNNGNVKSQDHWIPNGSGGVQAILTQSYTYDNLNRLLRVSEGSSWQQEYVYDRWGNRTIHQTNSWGTGVNKKDFTVNTANNRLGVPSGQAGAMSYDAAGNLINDTYTGAGSRVYDAENRMSKAWGGNNQWQEYSYNADGLRVRRKIDGSETRQIYGIAGELLAEYAGTASPATPQREYGYRNGQLLVTASAPVGTGTGLQGQYFDNMNFTDLKVTRTDATVNFDWGGGTPDPVISVDTFTTRWQGKVEPQYSQTYTFYTLTDDGVRLWVNGQLLIDKWIDQGPTEWSGQIALTAGLRYDIVMEFYENGGGATAKLSWSSASQTKQIIPQARLYPPGSSSQVSFEWLVADQLGTPRIILDKTGSLASTRRHDYSPFGEELYAGMGGRTTALGYTADTIRQKFTSKERDNETQLDYFLARYYSSTQGRFTSVDPIFFQKEMLIDPQRYNRYSYVRNNPLKYIDPEGQAIELLGDEEHRKAILEQLQKAVGQKAGALLYENKITDKNGNTRYFVGISGKAGDFAKINSLAAGFAAVIGDRRVAKLSIVAEDTKVQGYSSNQKALITAKDTHWVDPNPAITFPSSYGETTTYLLDPKVKYPHLPYLLMEDFKGAWDVAPSDVLAHEIGHVAAEWGLIVGDHKHISVAFENEARRLRDPNAKLRTGHSEPGDARRENWKLGIKIP